MRHPKPPATEEGSIGFLARRPDRPERFALFRPSGEVSNTFGQADQAQDIAARCGLRLRPVDGQPDTYLAFLASEVARHA